MAICVITGARDTVLIYKQFAAIMDSLHEEHDIEYLVLGDAKGIDCLGRIYRLRKDYSYKEFRVFKAFWDEYGTEAGPLRNGAMIRHALAIAKGRDIFLAAFPGEDSIGTWDCVRQFKQLVPTGIIEIFESSSSCDVFVPEGWNTPSFPTKQAGTYRTSVTGLLRASQRNAVTRKSRWNLLLLLANVELLEEDLLRVKGVGPITVLTLKRMAESAYVYKGRIYLDSWGGGILSNILEPVLTNDPKMLALFIQEKSVLTELRGVLPDIVASLRGVKDEASRAIATEYIKGYLLDALKN